MIDDFDWSPTPTPAAGIPCERCKRDVPRLHACDYCDALVCWKCQRPSGPRCCVECDPTAAGAKPTERADRIANPAPWHWRGRR